MECAKAQMSSSKLSFPPLKLKENLTYFLKYYYILLCKKKTTLKQENNLNQLKSNCNEICVLRLYLYQ